MEEGGVTELVAGAEMRPDELTELNTLENDLYFEGWCPKKATKALSLLQKRYDVLKGELKKIEAQIPSDRHSDEYAAQRHLTAHAEHVRYDLELTRLRREQYEAGLKHGHNHAAVAAIKTQTSEHIQRWLGRRA